MDNLKAEMQRNGLTVKDIMSTIGCSEKTARNKINGETDFTYPEARKSSERAFPGAEDGISLLPASQLTADPPKSARGRRKSERRKEKSPPEAGKDAENG